MTGIKQRIFRSALNVHTKLKEVPFYTQAYHLLKFKVLQRMSSHARLGDHFHTLYEEAPIRDDVIVYEAFHGASMACSPAAIYEAARDDPRCAGFEHIWVIDDPAAVPDALRNHLGTRIITRDDLEYAEALATARYLVNNSTFPYWYLRRDGQVYVNTWHGTPLKTMFRDEKGPPARFANSQRNFLQASHILMSSDFATSHLLGSAGIAPLCAPQTYIIGTPRLDRTLKTRANWTRDDTQQHILFAPTWKGITVGEAESQTGEIAALVDILRRAKGTPITLHVKAHNFNTDDLSDLAGQSAGKLHIQTVDPRADINRVMADMDVIITDYSSLMFDAMAADIPVVLFVPDLAQYSATRGLYLKLDSLPLAICHDSSALLTALKNLKPANTYAQSSTARTAYYPKEDGQAATRALDVMLGAPQATRPLATSHKPVIAIMPGGWKRNGITSSATNLLSNIDLETYHVVAMTDGRKLNEEAWEQIAALPCEIICVHRTGSERFTQEEYRVKRAFYSNNSLDDPADDDLMQRAMRREARRIIGITPLQASIDFSGYGRLWAWIMAMMPAKQHIIFQHNDLKSERDQRFSILEGIFYIYRHYDWIVAVSEDTRAVNYRNLSDYYPQEKTVALRNSLNIVGIHATAHDGPDNMMIDGTACLPLAQVIDETREEAPQAPDGYMVSAIPAIDPAATNFVTIGRFSAEKNHDLLLHAFKLLLQTQPQARLYILGEGPLLEQTRALRDELGLQNSVTLPGFTRRALQILRQCDCFVLPSRYEGQPMVILEALTLGKPVIVSDIPGSRSALQGGYGHIVEGPISAVRFADEMAAFCQGMMTFKPFDADAYNAQVVAEFHALVAQQEN